MPHAFTYHYLLIIYCIGPWKWFNPWHFLFKPCLHSTDCGVDCPSQDVWEVCTGDSVSQISLSPWAISKAIYCCAGCLAHWFDHLYVMMRENSRISFKWYLFMNWSASRSGDLCPCCFLWPPLAQILQCRSGLAESALGFPQAAAGSARYHWTHGSLKARPFGIHAMPRSERIFKRVWALHSRLTLLYTFHFACSELLPLIWICVGHLLKLLYHLHSLVFMLSMLRGRGALRKPYWASLEHGTLCDLSWFDICPVS